MPTFASQPLAFRGYHEGELRRMVQVFVLGPIPRRDPQLGVYKHSRSQFSRGIAFLVQNLEVTGVGGKSHRMTDSH